MGCINRDENAVNNMIKIVNTYLMNKTRPEKFRRDYKFPKTIKDDNGRRLTTTVASSKKDDNPIIIVINNSVKCH